MTTEELEEVRRREFLSTGPAVVGALLVGGAPSRGDLLDIAAAEIKALWVSRARLGSASVMRPVRLLAENLAGIVRTTARGSEDHRRAGELTGQAAQLAGVAARDQDLPDVAIGWRTAQIRAGQATGSAEQISLGLSGVAWTQFTALDRREQGLRTHDAIRLDGVSPFSRGLVELRGAEILGKAGKDDAALAALKRAEATVVDPHTYDGPFAGPGIGAITDQLIELSAGVLHLDLGYGALAYPSLKAAGRRLDWWPIQLSLARAAAGMGEPELACSHLARADLVAAEAKSPLGAREIREFAAQLAEIADTTATRDLVAQLRAGASPAQHRYVVTRTQSRGDGLHRGDCPYMRRGTPSADRHRWWDPTGRSPAELAADPAIQARYAVCKVCMK